MNDDTNRQRDQKPWEGPQAKWRLCHCTCISCIFAQSRQMADPARHCDKCDINNPPSANSGQNSETTGLEKGMVEGASRVISFRPTSEESIAYGGKQRSKSSGECEQSGYQEMARNNYVSKCHYCPKPVLCGKCPLRNNSNI